MLSAFFFSHGVSFVLIWQNVSQCGFHVSLSKKSSLKNKSHIKIEENKEDKNRTLNLCVPLILKYGSVNKNVISFVIHTLMKRHCSKGSQKC